MKCIFLYAELLNNIQSISLTITLPSIPDASTRIESDGQTVTVYHGAENASILLPALAKAPGNGNTELPLPPQSTLNLTYRFPLASSPSATLQSSDNVAPWKASELNNKTPRCSKCGTHVLRDDVMHSVDWRDLPSDDWAEMMDFWHCHKPHEKHSDHHGVGEQKGYGHSNRLQALPGVGLVGLTTVLLWSEDCMNNEPSSLAAVHTLNPPSTPVRELSCQTCRARLGVEDQLANGYKLDKWALSFATPTSDIGSADDEQATSLVCEWISVRLIAAIERSGLRKFIVTSVDEAEGDEADEEGPLELWIFSDDVHFSSSSSKSDCTRPRRAMKVFWKPARDDAAAAVLDGNAFSHERIDLPADVLGVLQHELRSSAQLLPVSARIFQTWQVGLLSRFD